MIRLVVFDFDGTLVESNEIKRRCFDEVVANIPGGADALAEARGVGGDRYKVFAAVARRVAEGAAREDVERVGRFLAKEYTRRCLAGIRAARERRGAFSALFRLKRKGMKMWVNSSTPQKDLPALLRARGVFSLFEGACGAPRSKLANLRAILAINQVSPQQTVVVGDGWDDYVAARAAGSRFVAVSDDGRLRGYPSALKIAELYRLPAVIAMMGGSRGHSSRRRRPRRG